MLSSGGALVSLFWAHALFLEACRAAPQSPPATGTDRPSAAGHQIENTHPGRRLHGRFLHITDIHPDPFYKTYASTEEDAACHRKRGPAGVYGAETSACDSPLSLIDETFRWIKENLRDEVDFVVWTGDSARHDNDEKVPRTQQQVVEQNEYVVAKFRDVFGKGKEGVEGFEIPIVPTFGNNDILPHNIFLPGPNRWTLKYLDIWRSFIPEAQRHGFQQGGWFYVEVVPQKLAVISLNTLYFFDSNSAVDGCANKKEPGYEHFEWLRIQLQMLRDRGMKAILTGHVPPARTDSKSSWDETCWQKFALWQKQYSDVITGSLFGHMNVDHFMVHDSRDLHKDTEQGKMGVEFLAKKSGLRESLLEDGEVTVQSVSDYLVDLGKKWAKLPSPPKSTKKGGKKSIYEYTDIDEEEQVSIWQWIGAYITGSKKGAKAGPDKDNDKEKKRKFWDEMGGKYGERFSIVQSAPSVVPNYFPTLRVVSYNISGLGHIVTPARPPSFPSSHLSYATADQVPIENPTYSYSDDARWIEEINQVVATKQKEKKERNAKKPAKKWRFRVPHSPSKSAPPGPAYSNQALTLLSYTQYFANLTHINNDFVDVPSNDSLVEGNRWKEGKHKKHQGKQPRPEPHPREFKFEVEYDTKHDERFKLKDLTVSSYVDLARRIGQDKCGGAAVLGIGEEDGAEEEDGDVWADGKKKKGKHGKKHKPKKNGPWFTFVKRAFVGSMDPHDVEDIFGVGAAGVEADLDVDEVLEL